MHNLFINGGCRGTIKLLGTLNKKMSTASVIQSHSLYLNFYTRLLSDDDIAQCQHAFGPKVNHHL